MMIGQTAQPTATGATDERWTWELLQRQENIYIFQPQFFKRNEANE